MNSCEVCSLDFGTKNKLKTHNRTKHFVAPKHVCVDCGHEYKNKRDIKRHKCKAKAKLVDDYLTWLEARMAVSTAAQVFQFRGRCFLNNEEWVQDSVTDLQEKIQYWQTQELCRVNSKTVATNLSSLLWLARYKQHTIVDWLESEVKQAHSFATIHNTKQSCLAMLDPFKMVTLRNQVVQALVNYQQHFLNPFIISHLRQYGLATVLDHRIGLEVMCWLDLVLRFCDVPCRMQVTQDMLLETEKEYVSKLGRGYDGEYYRIIDADKVGKWTQPVKIRTGTKVSAYLWFYLQCVRPHRAGGKHRVFPNQAGGRWSTATADVKKFLAEKLAIQPNKIDPSGRFIHGSRHIGLATFAARVNFDQQKLRNFAILMRHSLNTSEKVYNIWTHWWHTENAVVDFRQFIHGEQHRVNTPKCQNLVSLGPTPEAIFRLSAIEPPTKSVGTQTDFKSRVPIQPGGVVGHCGHQLTLFGPLGQSRHRRFACYWYQCSTCHPKQNRPVPTAHWKALGWKPPAGVVSASSKPRNWANIQLAWGSASV
jgi:hypothetical protein